jgi:L,D-transpeptidase ErfK/SrfK
MRLQIVTGFIILLFISPYSYASGVFSLDGEGAGLVGEAVTHIIEDGETLIELAPRFNVGYNEIVAANRHVDPWVPDEETEIIIPSEWILPDVIEEGIIINLAEMRLYYFFMFKNKKYVRTYPIGIGRDGSDTPTGTFMITGKAKHPVWNVPETVRRDRPELPPSVPPGPENPLGEYWLQLSVKGYGIHGTRRPYGIGRKVSYGCIRLHPGDIEALFAHVSKGAIVKIVDKPVKSVVISDRVYVEVHNADRANSELLTIAEKELSENNLLHRVEFALLMETINNATGLPAAVSK